MDGWMGSTYVIQRGTPKIRSIYIDGIQANILYMIIIII